MSSKPTSEPKKKLTLKSRKAEANGLLEKAKKLRGKVKLMRTEVKLKNHLRSNKRGLQKKK